MDLAEGIVRPDALALDVVGREPEDMRLARIDPDDGVGMGHERHLDAEILAKAVDGRHSLIWLKIDPLI